MDHNSLRDEISACLSQYREKVLRYNRAILEREITQQEVDKESDEEEDLDGILDELWGSESRFRKWRRNNILKVSDFFKHIPDGLVPIADLELQMEVLSKLELSLNQTAAHRYRPIAVPEEYKILTSLIGRVTGPGFPMLQETTIVSAFDQYCGDCKPLPDLVESTGLLPEYGWDLVVGWQCGSSMHHGSTHVVFGKCTQEEEFSKLGWKYVFKGGLDDVDVYNSLVDFINAYGDRYKELCKEGLR